MRSGTICGVMMLSTWLGLSAPNLVAADKKAAPAKAAAVDPEVILKKADDIRSPSLDYQMTVSVKNSNGDISEFDVSSKGKDKTVIRTLKPTRDKGRNFLMIREEMWAHVPNLGRAVRVSLNQKLTGQASNGDIARMRWSGDYKPVIESETDKEWTLYLTALRQGLTYDKLRLWVEKGTFKPLRAEYLTVQGTPLKRGEFGGWKDMAGEIRPTEIKHIDAKSGDTSVMSIMDIKTKSFPDSLFEQSSLK